MFFGGFFQLNFFFSGMIFFSQNIILIMVVVEPNSVKQKMIKAISLDTHLVLHIILHI